MKKQRSIFLWIFLFSCCTTNYLITVDGWGIFRRRQRTISTSTKPAFQTFKIGHSSSSTSSSSSSSSSLLESKPSSSAASSASSAAASSSESSAAATTKSFPRTRKGLTRAKNIAKVVPVKIAKVPVNIVKKPVVVIKEKRRKRKERKLLLSKQLEEELRQLEAKKEGVVANDGIVDDVVDEMTTLVTDDYSSFSDVLEETSSSVTSSSTPSSNTVGDRIVVSNVHQLRHQVLDQGKALADLDFDVSSFRTTPLPKTKGQASSSSSSSSITQPQKEELPFNHEVIQLIQKRFNTNSKPASRHQDDDAHLSLSIEGGGMRGAVSAGMASAIAVLGLSDCFDSIYGSSAGSVVGAYMISRQMCIDVYTQVITAAKSKFVSKKRLASSLAFNYIDQALNSTIFAKKTNMNPAMNISFVLDSIMCPENGLRPLDMDMFQLNDQKQQLRIVTSCVRDGKMETHCLGSKNLDFFDCVDEETGEVMERATTMVDGSRHGLFACLETSMTVPAATGPPLPLLRHKDAQANMTSMCFDAFCYEPIPYRSAVKEGATHVLVLKTRPEGNPIGTKPGLFENVFAPMYFNANGMEQVSEYFENSGQQYIYVEDYLTLDEGKKAGKDGVLVPPTKILYGIDQDEEARSLIENRNEWKKAHLLPLAVPAGTPELSTLSVDTMDVLTAVQGGFATAFDLLAPCTGIELDAHLNGERVAELLFAVNDSKSPKDILQDSVSVAGDLITGFEQHHLQYDDEANEDVEVPMSSSSDEKISANNGKAPCAVKDSVRLLETLPGFQNGKMESLASELQYRVKKAGR